MHRSRQAPSIGLGIGLPLTGQRGDGSILALDLLNTNTAPLGTYTRSTPAMQFDSSGVLGWGAHNLLTYSSTFDNAAWVAVQATPAGAVIAPDGTASAYKISETSAAASTHRVYHDVTTIASVYTLSVYAKAAERSWVVLRTGGGAISYFNIGTGVVGTKSGGHTTSSIESVGSGWYRCKITWTDAGSATAVGVDIAPADNTSIYDGAAGSGLYVWGAQLNRGTTALTYVPTTSAAVTNLPRPDYDPATLVKRGWLMDGSRTNLLLYSEDFTQANWTKTRVLAFGSGSVSNATTAPDGTTTADKVVEDTTASNDHYVQQSYTKAASAIAYSFSLFFKAAERTRAYLVCYGNGFANNAEATFNLSTGTVVSSTANGTFASVSATISSVGNGWYRCALNFTTDTHTSVSCRTSLDNGTTTAYTGDGTSGIYLWGAQLEAATFPSSYIPTTTLAASRSADLWTISNAQFLAATGQNIPQTGTMFVEFALAGGDSSLGGNRVALSLHDGTTNERNQIYSNSTLNGFTADGGAAQATLTTSSSAVGVVSKVAYRFTADNCGIAKNGTMGAADVPPSTMPTTTTLEIGGLIGSQQLYGWLRRIIIYPFAMTDAQLAGITA